MSGNEFWTFKKESDIIFDSEVDFEISFSWLLSNFRAREISWNSNFVQSSKTILFTMVYHMIEEFKILMSPKIVFKKQYFDH